MMTDRTINTPNKIKKYSANSALMFTPSDFPVIVYSRKLTLGRKLAKEEKRGKSGADHAKVH